MTYGYGVKESLIGRAGDVHIRRHAYNIILDCFNFDVAERVRCEIEDGLTDPKEIIAAYYGIKGDAMSKEEKIEKLKQERKKKFEESARVATDDEAYIAAGTLARNVLDKWGSASGWSLVGPYLCDELLDPKDVIAHYYGIK